MTQTRDTWNNRAKSFTVSVSADGETYVEVARVENHEWTKTELSMDLVFNTEQARYVRIDVDETAGRAFGEIEVYGPTTNS